MPALSPPATLGSTVTGLSETHASWSKLQAKKLVEKGAGINVEASSLPSYQIIKICYIFNRSLKDSMPYLTVCIFGKEITVLLDSGTSNTILASDLRLVLNKYLVKIKNCQLTHWTQAADMTKHCIDGQIVIPITLECRTRDI